MMRIDFYALALLLWLTLSVVGLLVAAFRLLVT